MKKYAITGRIIVLIMCVGLVTTTDANVAKASEWVKSTYNPVYTHEANAASDPSVIKDGSTFRMVVSGNGGNNPDANSLIMATSPDGKKWTTLQNGKKGVILPSEVNTWDKSLEMPTLIKTGQKYLIFYSGYDPVVAEASGGTIWGDLGLAISLDGVNFTRSGTEPVIKRTANWYDKDGITDPTVIEENGTLYMIYVGWCIQSCTQNGGKPAFYALKATSRDGGLTWSKDGLLDPRTANGGVASYEMIGLQHPALVKEEESAFSIYYGVDNACAGGKIGIYRAAGKAPFGPFTVESKPIFCLGTQSFETDGKDGGFPSVLIDGNYTNLYYTGVDVPTYTYQIGLAQKVQNTNDPTPTPSPTPTPTSTPQPIPQSTPTPTPQPDSLAFISNKVIQTTQNSAFIEVKTSIPTETYMVYGSQYGFAISRGDETVSNSHSFNIQDLRSGTKYYYIILAKDTKGNNALYSRVQSFTTAQK